MEDAEGNKSGADAQPMGAGDVTLLGREILAEVEARA